MSKKKKLNYYADENVTRIIAILVIVTLFIAVNYKLTALLFVLAIDFGLRAFTNFPSPVSFIAKLISKTLKLKPKYIFAAPKKFAAGIGFIFTLSILIFTLLNNLILAYSICFLLILFAALEAFFKICAGCYVYNWLIAPIVNRKNN